MKEINSFFQVLARIFLLAHFAIPLLITIFLFNGSVTTRSLNGCMGQFELNYFEASTQICTEGFGITWILCEIAQLIYLTLSTNIVEATMLYRCFQKIKEQTESSKDMLTKHSYIRRRK